MPHLSARQDRPDQDGRRRRISVACAWCANGAVPDMRQQAMPEGDRPRACVYGKQRTWAGGKRLPMTLSYFSGRTHLDAVQHAARLAIKHKSVCYVGLVRANPWTGPDEPVRYARWVACDLPSWGVWRDRVISLRSIQPSEGPGLLMRVRILRLRRERRRNRRDRERNQKHA